MWGITSACEVARQEFRRRGCSMLRSCLRPSPWYPRSALLFSWPGATERRRRRCLLDPYCIEGDNSARRDFMHRVYHGLRATDGGVADECLHRSPHNHSLGGLAREQFVLLRPVQRQIEFGQPRRKELDGLPTLQDRLDQLRLKKARTTRRRM